MKERIEDILSFSLIKWDNIDIHVAAVLGVIILILTVRVVLYLIHRSIKVRVKQDKLDEGKSYAIFRIITYFTYVISIVLIFEILGLRITVLLAGSTALLVGIGLGLQDIFKDWISGVALLMERTVTAGDIIEVDGIVGEVVQVEFRTTIVKTRDDIIIILPNQKLTQNNVVNWTQNGKDTRFILEVSVAYGSDTKRVTELLIEAATEHHLVLKKPAPYVHFNNFGDSGLHFRLLFFSHELFRIERIKSDLRYSVDKKFRDKGVVIPFPQRDLWIKNPVDLNKSDTEI